MVFQETCFFRNPPALNGFDFYSIDILYQNIIYLKNVKIKNLSHMSLKNLVFRDFQPLQCSDFYSTTRGDLDTLLYEIKKIEKNFWD